MEGREPATARPAETKSDTFYPPKLRTQYQDPGGEPSLSVIRCASIASRLVTTWKIDGVNIQFSKERIRPCMKSIWRGTYKTNNCAEI